MRKIIDFIKAFRSAGYAAKEAEQAFAALAEALNQKTSQWKKS